MIIFSIILATWPFTKPPPPPRSLSWPFGWPPLYWLRGFWMPLYRKVSNAKNLKTSFFLSLQKYADWSRARADYPIGSAHLGSPARVTKLNHIIFWIELSDLLKLYIQYVYIFFKPLSGSWFKFLGNILNVMFLKVCDEIKISNIQYYDIQHAANRTMNLSDEKNFS